MEQLIYVLDVPEIQVEFGNGAGYIRSELKKYKPRGELGITDEDVAKLYEAEETIKI